MSRSAPIHYDIESIRADYATINAAALADARSKAKTPGDQRGIDLQEMFLPLLVESTLISMQARNDGFEEQQIAKAIGHTIGLAFGNYLANMMRKDRVDCCITAFEHFTRMMEGTQEGGTKMPGMASAEVHIRGVRGGHA